MKIESSVLKIVLIVVLIIVLLFITRELVDGIANEIITYATAATGLVAILHQLNKDYQITKASFIYSLNENFSNNKEIQEVYKVLKEHRDGITPLNDLEDQKGRNMGEYIMFFQILHFLLEEKHVNLKLIDRLFANKFFIFVNNPISQKYQLKLTRINYPIVDLYCKWHNYRLKMGFAELYAQNALWQYEDYFLKDKKGRIRLNPLKMDIGYE